MLLEWQDFFFWEGIQLCCNVLDSIGGAESYSVSVSCVGSPANVQGLDSVPAPQSQKNLKQNENPKLGRGRGDNGNRTSKNATYLSCLINSTSCP